MAQNHQHKKAMGEAKATALMTYAEGLEVELAKLEVIPGAAASRRRPRTARAALVLGELYGVVGAGRLRWWRRRGRRRGRRGRRGRLGRRRRRRKWVAREVAAPEFLNASDFTATALVEARHDLARVAGDHGLRVKGDANVFRCTVGERAVRLAAFEGLDIVEVSTSRMI